MIRTLLTACPLDCPDTCSLHVQVDDGRLVKVDAAPVELAPNPYTQGFICKKVKGHAERVYGPDRVLTPLIRTGPKGTAEFREATWDEAMAVVAARVRDAMASTAGPASVVPFLYNSSTGMVASASVGPQLFASLGTSVVAHTICAAIAGKAIRSMVGHMLSADPADIVHSDCIVVWGANPSVSNTHLPPLINEAVRGHGAQLIVVDPRATGIARRGQLHLAVRPGTDAVLAMAMASEVARLNGFDTEFIGAHTTGFDAFVDACAMWTPAAAEMVCGVSGADITKAAEMLVASRRPFLRLGWGLERNRNGAASFHAVLGLRLGLGRFGEPGSGFLLSTGKASPWRAQDFEAVTSAATGATGAPDATGRATPPSRRVFNQNLLGPLLCDPGSEPPVTVLFVQGANPAGMNPDQAAVMRGLGREDLFTVVHDQVMSDTARWADVVLPATTHFETLDATDSYGSVVVQEMPAVINRVGESRANSEVIADLAARLGIDLGDTGAETLLDRGLRNKGRTRVLREPGTTVAFRDTWPGFEDRKARFQVPQFSPTVVPKGRLTLLSPASPRTINSIFGEVRHEPTITMHPIDAGERGVVDGASVTVSNELGAVTVRAHVNGETRPGVVVLPKGDWSRNYAGPSGESDGFTVNVLIPSTVDATVGGACFNDTFVDVAPV